MCGADRAVNLCVVLIECGADRAVNLCVVLIERSICVWC